MIVPMKKITVVVLDSKRRENTAALRKLGLVHLEGLSGSSPALEENREKAAKIAKALQALPAEKKKTSPAGKADLAAALDQASGILRTADEMKSRKDELERAVREYERIAPWGDFDPASIEDIKKAGYILRLYEIPKEKLKLFSTEARTFTVFRGKKSVGMACVADDESLFPKEWDSVPLPVKGLSELASLIDEKKASIASCEERLSASLAFKANLLAAEAEVGDTVEFEQVAAGMAREERISYVSGYIPVPKLPELRKAASANGWGLLVVDPSPEDAVPTLIKNPGWVSIIEPIFGFLGVAPGYREVDISTVFLLFFTFFFAMIIGDAGYGCIFFSLSLFLFFKEKKNTGYASRMTILLLLLTFATIVWGAVTGVWFGSKILNRNPILSWMVIPRLDGFVDENAQLIKHITFVIGLVHLSIAHVWNFFRELKGSVKIKAAAQVGWLFMVWGLYFFVLFFVLDSKKFPIPAFATPMVLVGYGLVLFLGQQSGDGFLKGMVRGLGGFIPTTLSSISVFADIISYIRLFAVGLAGVEISKSFNSMSSGMSSLGAWGIVPMVLILVAGHGLNMAMCSLSVLVHGVRLNLLEFSNHLGLEWAGSLYKPFKERI